MLYRLHDELLARGVTMRVIGAHGRVRDLLRADNVAEKFGGLDRAMSLDGLLADKSGTKPTI
jgi:hypothetical protein